MDIAEDVIPFDVIEAARRAEAEYDGNTARMVARAILAERERCAKVAEETKTFDWRGGDEWAAGYVDGKNAAASAIRSREIDG